MSDSNGTPPITEAAAQQAIAGAKQDLFNNMLPHIVQRLEARKAQHGMDGLDQAVVGEALLAFVHFIAGSQKFVVGADTDLLLNIGIEAISAAAVEAKKRVENKRIVTLR